MKGAEYGLAGDFIFTAAVQFLKRKVPLALEEYKKLDAESRARAFTVSGYTSAEVLQKFLDELSVACEQGTTKREFRDSMNSFLERNGYTEMNPFQADVIFRTNLQTAFNAGHYKSMKDPGVVKLRPYWKYVTAGDGDVRESHAAMEGRIYAADDPVWKVWYPPNGFRCRCMVVSMTRNQVERSGIPISKLPPHEVNYDTGEILYQYPDKGFSNNPAEDVWKPDVTGLNESLKKAFRDREMKKQ